MGYKASLIYNEALLRQAVWGFWRRTLGLTFLFATLLLAVLVCVLFTIGDRSWLFGVLTTIVSLSVVFIATLYLIHYRQTLHKFRAMESPQATFIAEEKTFTFSSDLGSMTAKWNVIQELWKFPRVWLLLYSKAQFSTLPLECLTPELQEFIKQRITDTGGKIVE